MRISEADTQNLKLFAREVSKPWCVLIPAPPWALTAKPAVAVMSAG